MAADKKAKRVLLVEDDEVNQLTLRKMLEKLGHVAMTAANGREALAMLVEHGADLILMDIQMPEMNGMEATRAIRADPDYASFSGTPIIAMTAYAMPGDREKFLESGMDAYLSKPVSMIDLSEAIAHVTDR